MKRSTREQSWGAPLASGMTLVELLMVMALLGLLLGAGVGMLSTLDLERRASVGLCQNLLRSARNSALARAGTAQVLLDRGAGTLTAHGTEVIGTWHFEGRLAGANGAEGVSSGATITDFGFIGKGLAVGQGTFVEYPVQSDPAWDFEHGFAIECALRVDEPGQLAAIDVGGVIGLILSGDLGARAWFVPRVVGEAGVERPGGRISLDLEPDALVAGRWHRLRLEYDRHMFSLSVDGVPLMREQIDVPVWRMEGPLLLGAEQGSGAASLDGLVVSAVAVSETVQLPDGVSFSEQTPPLVRFGPSGHLDRELHARAIEFALDFDDGQRVPLRIGMYGTVE